MYEFLLERQHFSSLRNYLDFLHAVPHVLAQSIKHDERLQSQGHALTSRFDAGHMRALAASNASYLTRLEADIPAQGKVCKEQLGYAATFTNECRAIAKESPRNGRDVRIDELDFRRFTLSRSTWWIWFPPQNVKDLIHELRLRLAYSYWALSDFKALPRELNLDIHNLFERIYQKVALPACHCYSRYSRIQAWYVEDGFSLPGMRNGVRPQDSSAVRLAKAAEHMHALFGRKINGCSAVNNLNDFFFVICRFLRVAEKELMAVKPTMKLSQLNSALALIEHVSNQIVAMTDRMQQWSRP